MLMPIRLALFDFDGKILDSTPKPHFWSELHIINIPPTPINLNRKSERNNLNIQMYKLHT